jgi:hypothetical protein
MLRVSKVKHLDDYRLQIVFNDGIIKSVDLTDLIKQGGYYFAPLEDVDQFKNVSIDDMNYSICWPNGADLSPDMLYEIGIEIKKTVKKLIRNKTIKTSRPKRRKMA